MSADMVIICKEDDSHFEGKRTEPPFFIDETSMGEPWSEFGKWFGERYCKAPNILEQLSGITAHGYVRITEEEREAIFKAVDTMETHKGLNVSDFKEYISKHVGKHISTENW